MVRLPGVMVGLLRPILRPLRRWVATVKPVDRNGPQTAPQRGLARRLADVIDGAVALGLWDHADRLAKTAAAMAPDCPRLVEALARLRLAQGDPERALRMIDTCRTRPASLRLLRATCLLFLGERTEAHLDLYRWSSRASAPLDARLLLGLLERGTDDSTAIRTLQRNLRHLEDVRTLQALLLINTRRGRAEQSQTWAGRLRAGCSACSDDQAAITDLLLQSLGMTGLGAGAAPTPDQVNALAMELITFESAIPTLAEAQRRRPHLPTARLLARAVELALPDLSDGSAALQVLARLSVVLGDREAALRFAERGLARNPMSAQLALLVDELTGPMPPDPAGAVAGIVPADAPDQSVAVRGKAA